jgi:hypothetical protein
MLPPLAMIIEKGKMFLLLWALPVFIPCIVVVWLVLHYILTKLEDVDRKIKATVLFHLLQCPVQPCRVQVFGSRLHSTEWYAATRCDLQMSEEEYDTFVTSCGNKSVSFRPWWLPRTYIYDTVEAFACQYIWYVPYTPSRN